MVVVMMIMLEMMEEERLEGLSVVFMFLDPTVVSLSGNRIPPFGDDSLTNGGPAESSADFPSTSSRQNDNHHHLYITIKAHTRVFMTIHSVIRPCWALPDLPRQPNIMPRSMKGS